MHTFYIWNYHVQNIINSQQFQDFKSNQILSMFPIFKEGLSDQNFKLNSHMTPYFLEKWLKFVILKKLMMKNYLKVYLNSKIIHQFLKNVTKNFWNLKTQINSDFQQRFSWNQECFWTHMLKLGKKLLNFRIDSCLRKITKLFRKK